MLLTEQLEYTYVADAYHSMEQFWSEMNLHAEGLSPGTIWDTYECGERRILEAKLAEVYGAPDAVVVGSGMAAIAVTLLALCLTYKLPIERGEWCGYFENSDLLSNVIEKLQLTAKAGEAGIRLVEPITNEPVMRVNLRGKGIAASEFTVIDNSLFSVSVPWGVWREQFSNRVCVVESLPKYLTHQVSGGVVYGEQEVIEAIRDTARRMGMLLPRHSCEMMLNEGSIDHVSERIERLSQSAEWFSEVLRNQRPELTVRMPHELVQGMGITNARSSLVFVLYPDDLDPVQEFEHWAQQASEYEGGRPMVRAGYGWDRTYGRAYGNNKLNTASGLSYLRFSIGLEERERVKQLASFLRRVNANRTW